MDTADVTAKWDWVSRRERWMSFEFEARQALRDWLMV